MWREKETSHSTGNISKLTFLTELSPRNHFENLWGSLGVALEAALFLSFFRHMGRMPTSCWADLFRHCHGASMRLWVTSGAIVHLIHRSLPSFRFQVSKLRTCFSGAIVLFAHFDFAQGPRATHLLRRWHPNRRRALCRRAVCNKCLIFMCFDASVRLKN